MHVQFGEVEEDLAVYRAGVDREVFYQQMNKWDYEGVKVISQKQFEKNRAHAVQSQVALGHKYLDNKEKVLYYTVGRQSYVVENKPIKYQNFDTNPLAFYDKMLDEELFMINANQSKSKGDETMLDDSMMTEMSEKSKHTVTKKSNANLSRMGTLGLKHMGTVNMNEKKSKRHIGARVDEVKAAI